MKREPNQAVVAKSGDAQWKRAALEQTAGELNENLAALQGLLRQLVGQADEKLLAMRSADTSRMHRCTSRESELLAQVARVEQQRGALVARLAQGLPNATPKPPPLRELARDFPEPAGSVLKARSVALRGIAEQLQEKNRLVARVAHKLQSHLREVFAEIASAQQESVVYGPKGQHEQRNARTLLDAVG